MVANLNLYLLLKQVAQTHPNIKLLNVYKGLPISYEGSINSVSESDVQIHSNRFQMACLYYQRETYLCGQEIPFLLRSEVVSLHLGKENVTLSSLEVAQKGIGERTQIRVEPEEPLLARIRFEGSPMEFIAPLADISAEGAAAHFEQYMFPIRLCRPGNAVSVTISLPDTVSQKIKKLATKPLPANTESWRGQTGAVVITTTGIIASVHPEPDLYHYRVGMRLFFKDLSRTVILQYVAQRQAEIIRDLSLLSEELYKIKNV